MMAPMSYEILQASACFITNDFPRGWEGHIPSGKYLFLEAGRSPSSLTNPQVLLVTYDFFGSDLW